jgi:hypothetical protein
MGPDDTGRERQSLGSDVPFLPKTGSVPQWELASEAEAMSSLSRSTSHRV